MNPHLPLVSTATLLLSAMCLSTAPLSAKDDAQTQLRASIVSDTLAAAVQEGSPDTGSARARRVFAPEDFDRFAPRSALDMAQRIPGFSIQSSDGNRGFGQANTNVIINGQRISGKSNGPVAALQRIPANEVVRLEIVDGASLDIGGLTGQVLNVVTHSTGGITGQYRWSAEWRSFGVPFRWGDAQISLAGGDDNTEWTLSLENDSGRRGDEGIEWVFDGFDRLIDTRDEKSNFNSDRITLSGSIEHNAQNGNIVNITGAIEGFLFEQREISQRSGTISPVDRTRLFTSSEDEFNYELGVDYSFDLGDGRLKLIGYHRFEDSPTVSEVVTSFADGSPSQGSRFMRDADEAETIARAEYTFAGIGGEFQLALEGVKNSLDIEAALKERDATGEFQDVGLAGSNARVEEDRAEGSITFSRAIAENLQVQASIGSEYSQISQSGTLGQTRSFWRPIGFAAFDWKANNTLNLSGRIERVVGQLDFFDFIASTDLDQGQVDVTNADLVPWQSWLFEAEATQDLRALGLGAVGSFNLRVFYEDISDIVDQIPIAGGGQAPGNIDSATIAGLAGELTLLFDPVGVEGMRLDAQLELSDSEVLDPLLGASREISGNEWIELDIDLRQDFVGTPWAIGGSFRYDERQPRVRLNEISQRLETPGFARVFIEHKDVFGMTARLRVGNILDRQNREDRIIFLDRVDGIVDFREDRVRRFGTIYSFDIEGSF